MPVPGRYWQLTACLQGNLLIRRTIAVLLKLPGQPRVLDCLSLRELYTLICFIKCNHGLTTHWLRVVYSKAYSIKRCPFLFTIWLSFFHVEPAKRYIGVSTLSCNTTFTSFNNIKLWMQCMFICGVQLRRLGVTFVTLPQANFDNVFFFLWEI